MRFLIIRFDKEQRKNKFIPIISRIDNFKNSKLFWAITVRNEIFKPETSIAVGRVRWNDRSQLNNHKNNCRHVLLCCIMFFFLIVRPSEPVNSATSSNLLKLKRFAVYSGRFAIQNVQDSLQGDQGAYTVTARGKQYFSWENYPQSNNSSRPSYSWRISMTSMAKLYWMSHNFPFYEERQDCIFIFYYLGDGQ